MHGDKKWVNLHMLSMEAAQFWALFAQEMEVYGWGVLTSAKIAQFLLLEECTRL